MDAETDLQSAVFQVDADDDGAAVNVCAAFRPNSLTKSREGLLDCHTPPVEAFSSVLLVLVASGSMGLGGAEHLSRVALAEDVCFELGRLSVCFILLPRSFDGTVSSCLSNSK